MPKTKTTEVGGERTAIRQCTCGHLFQDFQYGKGMRLHNRTIGIKDRAKRPPWRCTVCGKERD